MTAAVPAPKHSLNVPAAARRSRSTNFIVASRLCSFGSDDEDVVGVGVWGVVLASVGREVEGEDGEETVD